MAMKNCTRREFLEFGAAAAGAMAAAQSSALEYPGDARRPNFLFVFSDQQHWAAMGCMDSFFRTPALDALAAEGLLFEHAYCTTPQCSPSRSSLLTGLYPSATGVMGNVGAAGGAELKMETIATALQKAGWRTGYFGKWHLGDHPAGNAGWDEENRKEKDAAICDLAVDFLDRHKGQSQPFALFVSFVDPHDIYKFPKHKEYEDNEEIPLPESWEKETFEGKPPIQKQFMTSDQGAQIWGDPIGVWKTYRDFYRQKVELYDSYVGRILKALRGNDLAEQTIVFASSDHGDMDANHKLIYKGPFFYEHMPRIPFIARVPEAFGGAGPGRTDLMTVNVDVAPTILDFAGLPASDPCHGVSLKPILTGQPGQKERDYVVVQYYSKQKWVNPGRMLRTRKMKYCRWIDHGEELYDLENDPNELANRAGDPAYAAKKAELAALLDRWIEEHGDSFATMKTVPLAKK